MEKPKSCFVYRGYVTRSTKPIKQFSTTIGKSRTANFHSTNTVYRNGYVDIYCKTCRNKVTSCSMYVMLRRRYNWNSYSRTWISFLFSWIMQQPVSPGLAEIPLFLWNMFTVALCFFSHFTVATRNPLCYYSLLF